MSATKSQGKGGIGGVVVILVVLAALGVGAALMLDKGGKKQQVPPPPAPVVAPPTTLVEAPPPLPEVAPVIEAEPEPAVPPEVEDPAKPGTKKKGIPMGTIDAKEAQAVTKKNYAKVRTCYEKQLKLNNILQGGITVRIMVFPDGSVNSVKFEDDTVHNPAMNECIKKEILSWQFPKPVGGKAEVQQSYKFEPKAG